MPYEKFDRSRLILEPLATRKHDKTPDCVLPLAPVDAPSEVTFPHLWQRIVESGR